MSGVSQIGLDLVVGTPPKVRVLSDHRGVDVASAGRACDELAMRASVIHLGHGTDVLETPDVPRYVELITYAMDRLGWDAEEFEVFRCSIEYPVMPSSVVAQFDLPEAPTA